MATASQTYEQKCEQDAGPHPLRPSVALPLSVPPLFESLAYRAHGARPITLSGEALAELGRLLRTSVEYISRRDRIARKVKA
jgi:hypothetical protein